VSKKASSAGLFYVGVTAPLIPAHPAAAPHRAAADRQSAELAFFVTDSRLTTVAGQFFEVRFDFGNFV
jgi:hypothetical protein